MQGIRKKAGSAVSCIRGLTVCANLNVDPKSSVSEVFGMAVL